MALLDEVVNWAKTRPWWQQEVLVRLARGEDIGDEDCAGIASKMLQPAPTPPKGGWLAELTLADRAATERVRVLAVRDVEHVNRLAPGQRLTFAPDGLTVIFGRNGSGKSGYARVLQAMLRTRKRSEILPDVFGSSPCQGRAVVEYRTGDVCSEAVLGDTPPVDLGRAAFYDEKCGDDYLVTESQPAFRPSPLRLLDDLTHVCQRVRQALQVELQTLDIPTAGIPTLDDGTAAASWLALLSAQTTDPQIEAGCTSNPRDPARLESLQAAATKLRTLDPSKEKARLEACAAALGRLASHLRTTEHSLGATTADALDTLRTKADSLRTAAEVVSRSDFGSEPIDGVGGMAWRTLWNAAVAYSRQSVPGDHHHPPTAQGELCVLCQQPLSGEGASRMERFRTFVQDTTSKQAADAEAEVTREMRTVNATTVITTQAAMDLAHIAQSHPDLHRRTTAVLECWDRRRIGLLDPTKAAAVPADLTLAADLSAAGNDAGTTAAGLNAESIATDLETNTSQQAEVRSRIALAAAQEAVGAERDRLTRRHQIEAARTEAATKGTTDKIAELTRQHVTVAMQDRFSRESDRLGVERVTLRDTRARVGALLHKPDFVGATVSASLPAVLSEGEQTALGLAGFLTEAYFDESGCALVFDDPVTSLDHVRRDKVADSLVRFAADRQVIVFTHDINFTVDLRRSCESLNVTFTERSIRRGARHQPGYTHDKHPWSAQDAAQRLDTLKQRVAEIRRYQDDWDEEEYGKQVRELAGEMSETWERIISQEIAARLVKPDTRFLQPMMMKVLKRITEDDEKQFQVSYGRISAWAPRHDNHPDLNYVSPDLDDVAKEIDNMHMWFKRIKSYAN